MQDVANWKGGFTGEEVFDMIQTKKIVVYVGPSYNTATYCLVFLMLHRGIVNLCAFLIQAFVCD